MPPSHLPRSPGADLERQAAEVGRELAQTLAAVVAALPEGAQGPQKLARRLGIDKVLASRLLKAVRQADPLAVLHHAPGPEPMRRLLRSARRQSEVQNGLVATAEAAVERFDELIRREAGDRASFGAILSVWLPEAREEFELRRKQAAFRAMSELKGISADLSFSAVLVHPSREDERLDLVWVIGMRGLQRLRPGAMVRFYTRRMTPAAGPRHPTNVDGEEIAGRDRAQLDQFTAGPAAPIEAHQAGEVVHYTLGDTGFGPRSAVDVLFAEVNRAELPSTVPRGSARRAFFFHDVDTPSRRLAFDVFIAEGVYPGSDAELSIHDTCIRGTADVNDPARDIDRLDLCDSVQSLGQGLALARTAEVPQYVDALQHLCERMSWDPSIFRGFRTRIAYPIYGTQVSLSFRPPESVASAPASR